MFISPTSVFPEITEFCLEETALSLRKNVLRDTIMCIRDWAVLRRVTGHHRA